MNNFIFQSLAGKIGLSAKKASVVGTFTPTQTEKPNQFANELSQLMETTFSHNIIKIESLQNEKLNILPTSSDSKIVDFENKQQKNPVLKAFENKNMPSNNDSEIPEILVPQSKQNLWTSDQSLFVDNIGYKEIAEDEKNNKLESVLKSKVNIEVNSPINENVSENIILSAMAQQLPTNIVPEQNPQPQDYKQFDTKMEDNIKPLISNQNTIKIELKSELLTDNSALFISPTQNTTINNQIRPVITTQNSIHIETNSEPLTENSSLSISPAQNTIINNQIKPFITDQNSVQIETKSEPFIDNNAPIIATIPNIQKEVLKANDEEIITNGKSMLQYEGKPQFQSEQNIDLSIQIQPIKLNETIINISQEKIANKTTDKISLDTQFISTNKQNTIDTKYTKQENIQNPKEHVTSNSRLFANQEYIKENKVENYSVVSSDISTPEKVLLTSKPIKLKQDTIQKPIDSVKSTINPGNSQLFTSNDIPDDTLLYVSLDTTEMNELPNIRQSESRQVIGSFQHSQAIVNNNVESSYIKENESGENKNGPIEHEQYTELVQKSPILMKSEPKQNSQKTSERINIINESSQFSGQTKNDNTLENVSSTKSNKINIPVYLSIDSKEQILPQIKQNQNIRTDLHINGNADQKLNSDNTIEQYGLRQNINPIQNPNIQIKLSPKQVYNRTPEIYNPADISALKTSIMESENDSASVIKQAELNGNDVSVEYSQVKTEQKNIESPEYSVENSLHGKFLNPPNPLFQKENDSISFEKDGKGDLVLMQNSLQTTLINKFADNLTLKKSETIVENNNISENKPLKQEQYTESKRNTQKTSEVIDITNKSDTKANEIIPDRKNIPFDDLIKFIQNDITVQNKPLKIENESNQFPDQPKNDNILENVSVTKSSKNDLQGISQVERENINELIPNTQTPVKPDVKIANSELPQADKIVNNSWIDVPINLSKDSKELVLTQVKQEQNIQTDLSINSNVDQKINTDQSFLVDNPIIPQTKQERNIQTDSHINSNTDQKINTNQSILMDNLIIPQTKQERNIQTDSHINSNTDQKINTNQSILMDNLIIPQTKQEQNIQTDSQIKGNTDQKINSDKPVSIEEPINKPAMNLPKKSLESVIFNNVNDKYEQDILPPTSDKKTPESKSNISQMIKTQIMANGLLFNKSESQSNNKNTQDQQKSMINQTPAKDNQVQKTNNQKDFSVELDETHKYNIEKPNSPKLIENQNVKIDERQQDDYVQEKPAQIFSNSIMEQDKSSKPNSQTNSENNPYITTSDTVSKQEIKDNIFQEKQQIGYERRLSTENNSSIGKVDNIEANNVITKNDVIKYKSSEIILPKTENVKEANIEKTTEKFEIPSPRMNNDFVSTQKTDIKNISVTDKNEMTSKVVELPDKITQYVSTVKNDTKPQSVMIQLEPAHLGKIKLKVSVKDNRLMAEMSVASLATKEIIEAQLPDIKRSLMQYDLQVSGFNITLDNGSSKFGSSNPNSSQQSKWSSESWNYNRGDENNNNSHEHTKRYMRYVNNDSMVDILT